MAKNILLNSILVTFGIYLLFKKSMLENDIIKKYGEPRLKKFNLVLAALKKLNLTALKLKFLISQVLLETGFFDSKSNVYDLNNNASGIFWSGSAAQIATGAKKGSKRLSSEGSYYAKYENLDDWAKDYYRIITQYNPKNNPLNSNTITEFTTKLKANNYFTDTIENYLKNITFWYNYLIKINF
jgi:flagellum-specific peptidoglycan hydrolase FlgJ